MKRKRRRHGERDRRPVKDNRQKKERAFRTGVKKGKGGVFVFVFLRFILLCKRAGGR